MNGYIWSIFKNWLSCLPPQSLFRRIVHPFYGRRMPLLSPPIRSCVAFRHDAVGVEFATGMVQPCPAWWDRRINQTRKQQTVDNHPRNTPAIPFHPSGNPSSHPASQQPGGGEGRSYSTRKKKGGQPRRPAHSSQVADQPECGIHPSLRGI